MKKTITIIVLMAALCYTLKPTQERTLDITVLRDGSTILSEDGAEFYYLDGSIFCDNGDTINIEVKI